MKIDPTVVPVLSQPETAGVANFTIIQDKRDNPTDAHHGVYTTLDLSYAPGFLGTQTHFARGLFRNSTYHFFGRDLVFARSTQFGIIQRTGGKNESLRTIKPYSARRTTSIRAVPLRSVRSPIFKPGRAI